MDWADAIRTLTATLDDRGEHRLQVDPTLTDDVTAFVPEGTNPGVLQRLASVGGQHLGMSEQYAEGEHPARAPTDLLIRSHYLLRQVELALM